MFRDNLDDRLDQIVQTIKSGASLRKEASELSASIKDGHDKFASFSSSLPKKLLKLASAVREESSVITYRDVYEQFSDTSASLHGSDNAFLKAADELRSAGIEEQREKVASLLNAATGLVILKKKLEN
jgi:VIT1/CCC1 family predicted Fe2+/Mn2+ transporter